MMNLEALDHVGLAVSDVDRSLEWYQRVLGLERAFEEAWGTYPAVLVTPGANGLPGTGVALFPARSEHIEPSTFSSLAHVGFRATREQYEHAKAELATHGIEFRESDHKVAMSIYVLDPDSHLIEISTYDV
jgi:catechol 2,3-dioxygenase-like lactoylglutathione lyase family enzyme